MKIGNNKIVGRVIIFLIFLVGIILAFYLGMQHEITIQKDQCQCWDGVNNICLPVTACE